MQSLPNEVLPRGVPVAGHTIPAHSRASGVPGVARPVRANAKGSAGPAVFADESGTADALE